jgi:hypothetical protein
VSCVNLMQTVPAMDPLKAAPISILIKGRWCGPDSDTLVPEVRTFDLLEQSVFVVEDRGVTMPVPHW